LLGVTKSIEKHECGAPEARNVYRPEYALITFTEFIEMIAFR